MKIPSKKDFCRGVREFKKHEERDAMYKVATFLISHFWGKPSDMADGLGVLLLTWNQAFYRYGYFDFDRLERCIARNLRYLETLKKRHISSFSDSDEKKTKALFNQFNNALQIRYGSLKGRKSPVAVAKALHLLAPNFYPLWDYEIARAYSCSYSYNPAEKYVSFCKIIKGIEEKVKDYIPDSGRSIIKLVDEYNYSKYTQEWI